MLLQPLLFLLVLTLVNSQNVPNEKAQLLNQTIDSSYFHSRYAPELFPMDCFTRYQTIVFRLVRAMRTYPPLSSREKFELTVQLLEMPLPYRLPQNSTIIWPLKDWFSTRNSAISEVLLMPNLWDLLNNNYLGLGRRLLDALLNAFLVNDNELQKSLSYTGDNTLNFYDATEPAWEDIIRPLMTFFFNLVKYVPNKSMFGQIFYREETVMRLSVLLGSPDQRERKYMTMLLYSFFKQGVLHCNDDQTRIREDNVSRIRSMMTSLMGLVHDGLGQLNRSPSDVVLRASKHMLKLLRLMLQSTAIKLPANGSFSGHFFQQLLMHTLRDRALPLFEHRHYVILFQKNWQKLYETTFKMLQASPDQLDALQEAFLSGLFRRNGNRSRDMALKQFDFLLDIFLEHGSLWLQSSLLPLYFGRIFAEIRINASSSVRKYVLESFLDTSFLQALMQPRSPSAVLYQLTSAKAFLNPLFDWFLDREAIEHLQKVEPM